MIHRPGERERFRDALLADGRVRVGKDRLWELWAQAAPRLAATPEQATALDEVLRSLADDDVIGLPSGAWDRSTFPPLPRSVIVPAARRERRVPAWKRRPWRPELGWVSSLTALSDAQFADLCAIDDWLRARSGEVGPTVPVRYRSVEIFGAEKRLGDLSRSALFGPGRLTHALLGCEYLPPPLPAVAVGDGPDVLVVENSDPFWVAVAAARAAAGPVGAVVWGSGNSFPAQLDALAVDVAGRGPVTGTVWYWGDLDPAGVGIAQRAAIAAERAGLPLNLPGALWEAMVDCPWQDRGEIDWSGIDGVAWFEDQCPPLARVRDARARVAQEAVPPHVVTAWLSETPD